MTGVAETYRDAAAVYAELGRMIDALQGMQRDRRLTVPHGGPAETGVALRQTLDGLYAAREACSTLQTDQDLGH